MTKFTFQVGCTPLHRAASTGNREMCELLIEEGADVDAVDRGDQTPLMHAVICHNKEVRDFYFATLTGIWNDIFFLFYKSNVMGLEFTLVRTQVGACTFHKPFA